MLEEIFDVIGIGFGPAGIALAAAIEDHRERDGGKSLANVLFLERRKNSSWQEQMLLPGTDIQNHYLRDFATVRNPRSRFTFPNYLKEKNRIFEFGELVFGASGGAVSRIEWSHYNEWVATQLSHLVRYNCSVLSVEPACDVRPVELFKVVTDMGSFLTRNVVLCNGRKPKVPELYCAKKGPRIFHSSAFLRSIKEFSNYPNPVFAVLGSGQNAIEILIYLYEKFHSAQLYSIHRSIGFRHVDLCQFSNEVFHPPEVDYFNGLTAEQRMDALKEARPTNYSAVDREAGDNLYRKMYEDLVLGRERIHMRKRTNVTDVKEVGASIHLCLRDRYTGAEEGIDADALILCTGFTEDEMPEVLHPLRSFVKLDGAGFPLVSRDYRLQVDEDFSGGIYLSSGTERTHGPGSSTSFSMMALKSERILNAILAEEHIFRSVKNV